MNDSAASRSVVIERQLSHPPEKVWRALTQGALIEEWLMKNDFKPVVGHKFTFRSKPMPEWDGVIDAQVTEVESQARLSYTWSALGLQSIVTWTLTPASGGTHLRMEQSGFRLDQEAAYRGANYGWQRFIGNLERVLGERA